MDVKSDATVDAREAPRRAGASRGCPRARNQAHVTRRVGLRLGSLGQQQLEIMDEVLRHQLAGGKADA